MVYSTARAYATQPFRSELQFNLFNLLLAPRTVLINSAWVISDNYMKISHLLLFQVQTTVKRHWAQFKTQWNQRWGRRTNNRSISNAAASAEAGDIPVYICHQEPRNELANNLGGEGAEVIALEIIEQESSAWMWINTASWSLSLHLLGEKQTMHLKWFPSSQELNISFVKNY